MPYEAKPFPFAKPLTGVSEKTIQIHHDKLYAGYVAKMKEVGEKLRGITPETLATANQSYSELRALRDGETFATNGVYLHEYYFSCLGGDGLSPEALAKGEAPKGALVDAIVEKWGSLEKFVTSFSATGMAVRGWVVLAWDTHLDRLKIYGVDAHNQGGVWGAIPIIVLDVYEHAYFIDYGADRKKYIEDFWKNLNWEAVSAVYGRISGVRR